MSRSSFIIGGAWLLAACGSTSAGGPDAGGSDAAGSNDGSSKDVATTDAGDAGGGDGGFVLPSGRSYPDTFATIALLVDQLPSMSPAQMQFATSHYVGTEKQLLPVTQQLRALNPNFLVLHYHLCMWQSAPATDFIVNGTTWGNDSPTVTMNETWFWHNTSSERVTSNVDGK